MHLHSDGRGISNLIPFQPLDDDFDHLSQSQRQKEENEKSKMQSVWISKNRWVELHVHLPAEFRACR